LSPEEAQEVIAEAAGVSPDELDPSRLTWRQYLQIIERLEQLETTL
jgi:lambda repressor-like predicted transcriptional regulator